MKDILAFLKSKQFFLHFSIATVTVVITLWILVKMLSSYTNHDETVDVPDFKGKSIAELKGFIEGKDLRCMVIDSVYNPKEKPGTIISQDPEAKSKVKHNRMVYLYVICMQPPQVSMPKLIDRSARQAVLMIKSYGLKLGKINEVSGDCNGCVLMQYANGKEIAPGEFVKKGSRIDISVGRKNRYENLNIDTTGSGNTTPSFDEEDEKTK